MKIYEVIANELVKKPEERSFHFKQIEGWLKKIGYVILPLRLGTLKGIGFSLNENHSLGECVAAEVTITEKEACMTGNYKLVSYMQMEMHDLFLKWNKFMKTKCGEEEVREMTKDDLKTGMVVELLDGSMYMVLQGDINSTRGIQRLVFVRAEDYLIVDNHYENDLTDKESSSYDIIAVYQPPICSFDSVFLSRSNQIWKRKSTREACLEKEIENLKAKLKEAEVELEKERGK